MKVLLWLVFIISRRYKNDTSIPTADNTAYTLRNDALALWDIAFFNRNVVYAENVKHLVKVISFTYLNGSYPT